MGKSTWLSALLATAVLTAGCGEDKPPGKPDSKQDPAPAAERLVIQTDAGPVETSLAVRVEQLLVTPATGPVTHVRVRNIGDKAFVGTVQVEFPAGWKLNQTECGAELAPHETVRLPFALERAANAAGNEYGVTVRIPAANRVHRQTVFCASAPYFKPVIDGKLDDWKDAIPVTFLTGGKKTTVSTYWSSRRFSLLVAVEEDAHVPAPAGTPGAPFDAVQIALAAADATTSRSPGAKAKRHEFLLAGGTDGKGACYSLIQPGEKLSGAKQAKPLAGREVAGAEAAVVRKDGWTYYECAIPFKHALGTIRPDPGREFRFSVLVHDPDGTHLRDWGESAGLWPWQRNRLAWCDWPGAKWPKEPPFDGKIEYGFCSASQ